jgi:hypothetical protein
LEKAKEKQKCNGGNIVVDQENLIGENRKGNNRKNDPMNPFVSGIFEGKNNAEKTQRKIDEMHEGRVEPHQGREKYRAIDAVGDQGQAGNQSQNRVTAGSTALVGQQSSSIPENVNSGGHLGEDRK